MIIREELCIQQPADLMRRMCRERQSHVEACVMHLFNQGVKKRKHTTHFPLLSTTRWAAFMGMSLQRNLGSSYWSAISTKDRSSAQTPVQQLQGKSKHKTEQNRKSWHWHYSTDALIAFLCRNEPSLNTLCLNHRLKHKICFRAN